MSKSQSEAKKSEVHRRACHSKPQSAARYKAGSLLHTSHATHTPPLPPGNSRRKTGRHVGHGSLMLDPCCWMFAAVWCILHCNMHGIWDWSRWPRCVCVGGRDEPRVLRVSPHLPSGSTVHSSMRTSTTMSSGCRLSSWLTSQITRMKDGEEHQWWGSVTGISQPPKNKTEQAAEDASALES